MIARLLASLCFATIALPTALAQYNTGYTTAPTYLLTFDTQPTSAAMASSQGGFTWLPEVEGRAGVAFLDRTARNYIDMKRYPDINNRVMPDIGGEISVEMWFLQQDFGNWQRFWSFANTSVDANGFPNANPGVGVICGGNPGTDATYRTVSGGLSGDVTITSTDAWGRLGEFNHMAVTIQQIGTTVSNAQAMTSVYVNGRLIVNGTTFLPPVISRTVNWIGRSEFMLNSDAFFMGAFDTFAVYSYPLSQEAVWAHAQTSRPPVFELTFAKNPTTLVGASATPTYSWLDSANALVRGVVVLSGTSQSVNLLTSTGTASVGTSMPASINGASSGSPTARGWTYAVTVSVTTVANNAPIFDMKDAGTNRVRMYLNPQGNVVFVLNTLTITSSSVLQAGRFYHIAAAVSSTGNGTLYIDTQAVGTGSGSALAAFTVTSAFLGQSTDATPVFLAGRIDSMRVYDIALTATEVAGLALTITNAPTGEVWTPRLAPVTQSGPVASYTFSKPPPAFGTAGLSNFTYVPSLLGRQGMAFFDGVKSVINLRDFPTDKGDLMPTLFSGGMTFEADFQYLSSSNQAMVYSFFGPRGVADNNLHLMNTWWQAGNGNTNTLRSETYSQRGYDGNTQLDCLGCNSGAWTHTIVSIQQPNASDSTSARAALITMYVNGLLIAQKYGPLPSAVYRPNLLLGQSGWAGDALFYGNIDAFHWYNYGLSEESAYVHFLLPTPPSFEAVFASDPRLSAGTTAGYGWQFNESVPTVHQGMLVLAGGTQFVNLSATSGANFIGFTTPLMTGNGRNTGGVPVELSNGWSFDVVFNPTTTASGVTIVDIAAAGGSSSLSLAFNAQSEVVFTHGTATLNCGSVSANAWTSIAIVVAQDGQNIDAQCYKNGVRAASRSDFPAIPYVARNSVLLGKSNTGTATSFNGQIDAFRIMSYTLTSEDVGELYRAYSNEKRVPNTPAYFSGPTLAHTFDTPPPNPFTDPSSAPNYNYWTWSEYGPSYASTAANRRRGVAVFDQPGTSRALRQFVDLVFDEDAYGSVMPQVWGGSMSFELWVNLASPLRTWERVFDTAYNALQDNWNTAAGEYSYNILLAVNGDGANRELMFQHYATAGNPQPQYNIYVTNGFVPNTWQHIVCTIEQTTAVNATMRVYIDGELRGTNAGSPVPPVRQRQLSYLGRSNWNDNSLNGTIDAFYYYNYALSQAQIRRNRVLPNPPYYDASFETNPARTTPATYDWVDVDSTGHNGSLSFNGVNQYADLFSGSGNASIGQVFPSINGISIGIDQTGFSFEMSCMWKTVTNSRRVFDLGNGNGVDSFAVGNVANNAVLYINNGLIDETSTIPLFKITANSYYHLLIVGTPIGSANSTYMNYQIYVRGNLVASHSSKIAPTRMIRRVAYLGRSTVATDSYFHGNVDLLRYYTYAISAQHAATLSTLSGPTAEYVAPDAVLSSSTGAGGPGGVSSSAVTTVRTSSSSTSTSTGSTSTGSTSTNGTETPATSTGLDDGVNGAVRSASTIVALFATAAFAVMLL